MLVENFSVPADPRVWNEARALREHGHAVCVICPRGEHRDRAPYEVVEGIHIYRYAGAPSAGGYLGYVVEYGVAAIKMFALSLRIWWRHGIDAVHAANPPDTLFVIGVFYKALGKPYVFDLHDLAPELFRVRFRGRSGPLHGLLDRGLGILEACSCRVANVVITTNEAQRAVAIARGRCRPEKVVVVRNGPDLRDFHAVPTDPGLKGPARYRLAYLGVMGAQDGVEYALHALRELVVRRGRRDVSLVLIGDGDRQPHLQALARELDLGDHVTFTGWLSRPDALRYLAVADVGLTPDPSNELNDRSTLLKTLEYMAIGKPMVAFDTAETRYSAGAAALYASPNRVEDFADQIETLLDDEARRLAMGAYGRRRIETELCWDLMKLDLWGVYEELFARKPALERRAKRRFDVIGAASLLVVTAPVLALIAVLIKVSSRGPVLYTQTRLGLGGRPFVMYKFRSMYEGADATIHRRHVEGLILAARGTPGDAADARWAPLPADPRVTPVGRILRRLGLDELPQLVNVLRGEMSLVGPRPALPFEVDLYEDWHRQRFDALPGITGFWQVRARYRGGFDDMVRADLEYLGRRSLWLDIKLLAQTLLATLAGKGIG
jgi:lipopolysaccharide/colanic/teichoic acid biosynthesis glycosyltransferase